MTTRPQPHPTATWRAAVAKLRENTKAHHSSTQIELLLWEQGFGPKAAAAILDWWCSCHPDVIAAERREPT